MRRWLLLTGVAAGVVGIGLAIAAGLVSEGFLAFNHPPASAVRGLDVSHHQGAIDWPHVDATTWKFVWIKATEGGDWQDPRFAENWAGARAAGLVPGAYHFYTLCRPAAEQAANFLAVVHAEGETLPPALDVELGGNCGERPTRAALLADIAAFSDRVEATLGRRPILYLTNEMADLYQLDRAGTWLRSVFWEPEPGWAVWQYGNRGRVEGITGPVDLNVLAGGLGEVVGRK